MGFNSHIQLKTVLCFLYISNLKSTLLAPLICKQECWGCISHSGADFSLGLFSTQTHLFIVGSWKESTTVCQDILYFSEPSISEIRSVKTQNHTINSANPINKHREQICTKLLTKNSHFLLLMFWFIDSSPEQWCRVTEQLFVWITQSYIPG